MIGKVTTRYMTEEERLAYIKKYPIVPKERPKGSTFVSLEPVTFVNNKKIKRHLFVHLNVQTDISYPK